MTSDHQQILNSLHDGIPAITPAQAAAARRAITRHTSPQDRLTILQALGLTPYTALGIRDTNQVRRTITRGRQ